MSDPETFVTIRATVDKLQRLAELASAGFHDDIYLKVQDDTVNALMSTGGSFLSYATFDESFFAEIDGDGEAFVPVERYQSYLQQADGDGIVEMSFLGEEDDDSDHPRLASHWKASGAMNVQIRLPGSESDLDAIPWGMPVRFNADQRYLSQKCMEDGEPPSDPADEIVMPTVIETTAETVQQRIIDKADFVDVGWYPIVTDSGTLKLEIDHEDDQIWGDVDADVDGPDVSNAYNRGFDDLFGALEGDVRLATAPTEDDEDDAPLIVTQVQDDYVGRHVIGSYAKQ